MKKLEFTHVGAEKRLSRAVSDRFDYSFSYVQKLIRKKDVRVNGKKVSDDVNLRGGDFVTVYAEEESARTFVPVYEDENLAVYHKPVRLASEGENSLVSLIPDGYLLCHRLDTNTEGLILVAKSLAVQEEIVRAIRAEQVEKYYTAVVIGRIKKDGTITGYLVKDKDKGIVYVDSRGADEDKISTPYTVLQSFEDKTVVSVKLVRGKTHQIRASFAHIEHPIIGDGKYGTNEINRKYSAKTQWLCSTRIVFRMPESSPLAYLNGVKLETVPKTFKI